MRILTLSAMSLYIDLIGPIFLYVTAAECTLPDDSYRPTVQSFPSPIEHRRTFRKDGKCRNYAILGEIIRAIRHFPNANLFTLSYHVSALGEKVVANEGI